MADRFALTSEARANVEEILVYVEQEFGADVADRVFDDLYRAFRLIGEHPEIGRSRPELWPLPYLFWPVGPALVAYRADSVPVQIVAVDRAERDWPRLDIPKKRG